MVQLKYTDRNLLFVGGYRIKPGMNEMSNVDFYKLMNNKFFKNRVENGVLEVPKDFPLENPNQINDPGKQLKEAHMDNQNKPKSDKSVQPKASPNMPLVKPADYEEKIHPEHTDVKHKHVQEDQEMDDTETNIKEDLKHIEKSNDENYLQNLIDTDERPKVVDAAKKRMKHFKK